MLASSTLEARDEALAAGADAFLQKPIDPVDLVSTVKDLLAARAPLKSRASAHDPEVREFDITADGIVLGEPVAGD